IGIENQQKELWEQSLRDFAEASSSYGIALNVARSDPRLYQRDCERALQMIEVRTKIERSFPNIGEEELLSCDRMIQLDPEWSEGYFQKSRIYFRIATACTNQGVNADEWFQKAIQSGEQAVRRNAADTNLYKFITLSYAWLAHLETERGRDPTPTLMKLIECSQKEKSLHMTSVAYYQMGTYQMQIGKDPMHNFEAALKGFEQSKKQSPESMEHFNRIGRVKTSMAEYLIHKGLTPGQLINEAISDFEKVISKFPRYPDPHSYMSHAWNIQAAYEISQGKDPQEFIDKAILHANKSSELDPHHAEAYLELGYAFILKGKDANNHAKKSASNWQDALKALERAVHENPTLVDGYLKSAEAHLLRAEIIAKDKLDTSQDLLRAQAFLKKASSLSPNHVEISRLNALLAKNK
ncbi:hypothetical protein L0152_14710, partial [bacterium]|nr:hypothetical protein [bacterium]